MSTNPIEYQYTKSQENKFELMLNYLWEISEQDSYNPSLREIEMLRTFKLLSIGKFTNGNNYVLMDCN